MNRIIKRYLNRKLYDVARKRYVALVDIAALVQQGQEVQIIEQATGEDITTEILSKIITAALGQEKSSVSKNVLIDVIRRRGEAMLDYVKKSVYAGVGSLTQAGAEVERKLKGIIGPIAKTKAPSENALRGTGESIATLIEERLHGLVSELASISHRLSDVKNQLDLINTNLKHEGSRKALRSRHSGRNKHDKKNIRTSQDTRTSRKARFDV